MKLVTINTALFDKYKNDVEILTKSKRPYVLVIRLKYKGEKYDFAVPIRSNIPAATPKNQYFSLPPRPTTRPKNRKTIVNDCQAYLDNYSKGHHPQFSTDIDYLLSQLMPGD